MIAVAEGEVIALTKKNRGFSFVLFVCLLPFLISFGFLIFRLHFFILNIIPLSLYLFIHLNVVLNNYISKWNTNIYLNIYVL